ncbi:MAG: ferredoxin family protein, partial [Candidatus Bathyarchaeota archaeon]|nr:ferredoxin family protein [Candidatus Bathyarchaeota archaeon]
LQFMHSGAYNIVSHQNQSKTRHPPWFPTINTDQCDTCQHQFRCVTFCPHNVYEVRAHTVVVAHPLNCIYRCSSCANICPRDAIIFPSTTSTLKSLRKPSLLHRVVCKDCGKRFMTSRNTEHCFDCEARIKTS